MQASSYTPKPKRKFSPIFPVLLTLSFLAGLFLTFAFAPYGVWVMAIISPLVLYAILMTKLTPARAFLVGWVYGFGVWFSGAFWLYYSIYHFGGVPSLLAFLMIVVMAILMGLFSAVQAWLFVRFFGRQPLGFAGLWVVQEWVKTWLLSGFPWLFVGYAYTELPTMTALAPVVGVFGISFVSVLLSASLVEIFRKKAGYFVISLVLLGMAAVLSVVRPTWTTPTGQTLAVSLVQANIAQSIKWDEAYYMDILATYANLSKSEWGQDLVVWSEGAIPLFQDEVGDYMEAHHELAKTKNSVWVTGLPYKAFEEFDPETDIYPPFYNAVVALGQGSGIYKKQRLVPFGEYIPMEGMLDILPNLANNQAILSHSRGAKNQAPLDVKGKNMGLAICYEVAYPETTRHNAKNSDFMLTLSNDAWFGDSAGPHQHLQMVQMRAMETGRWFVRSTNNGITAIINEKGQFMEVAPQFKRLVLRGNVVMMTGETPFVKWGQTPILTLVFLLCLLSIWAGRQRAIDKAGIDKSGLDKQQLGKNKQNMLKIVFNKKHF